MESSLHRQLKERYGPAVGGRAEVVVEGYRIDAVAPDGVLTEVQSGALGPLWGKLRRLLSDYPVRVVKPVVLARRIVRRDKRTGADVSVRLSPKRGALVDVFDDLIGLARIFPHPNLTVEVLGVEIDEIRLPRRRWPGFAVVDRRLREITATVRLHRADDLWALLPDGFRADSFTTLDLADRLERPAALAQRIAYCLRQAGAVETLGKIGNRRVYLAASASTSRGVAIEGARESVHERPGVVSS